MSKNLFGKIAAFAIVAVLIAACHSQPKSNNANAGSKDTINGNRDSANTRASDSNAK
jgi:hypothetical protein